VAHFQYRCLGPWRSRFVCFNFAVVFIFNVFPFPPSKAPSLGDVPMNRKKCSKLFASDLNFVFCVMEGDRDAPCANRQYAWFEFAASIILKLYFADFFLFTAHRL
jgi:hypothetical protein